MELLPSRLARACVIESIFRRPARWRGVCSQIPVPVKLEDIGLIGNCQFAALVHASGDVVWCCWPRFDSEPVFGKLLDPDGGRFGISAPDGATGHQQYLDNTNV